MASTIGQTIKCRAAVTWSAGCDFKVEEIYVAPPGPGEVRIQILYSSLCGTDVTMWKEPTPFKLPAILGHEGSGIIESVGEGVTDLKPGDSVISLIMVECQKCDLCKSPKTNLCELVFPWFKEGVMPSDGKTRFSTLNGEPIYNFVNCSTFTQYTVMIEGAVAKIDPAFPLYKACLLSCGVTTGLGSVWNIAKLEAGSTVAVIGLGTVGLAVIEAAKLAGASRIIGIDVEPRKFELAKKKGATDCINPKDDETIGIEKMVHEIVKGGVDYSFECVGSPKLMTTALECCSLFGTSIIVGATKFTDLVTFSPWLMIFGRQWKSGAFGAYKGKSTMHSLIDKCRTKEIDLDDYITHQLPFSQISKAFELMKSAACVKCVFHMDDDAVPEK